MSRVIDKKHLIIKLAWRSLWRHKRRSFLTISAVSLGLVCALFFVTLAEGVYQQLVDDGVRLQAGHLTLEHVDYRQAPAVDLWIDHVSAIRGKVKNVPGISDTKALVLGQGIAKSGWSATGVALFGVEPSIEKRFSPLTKNIIRGDFLDDTDQSVVLIGKDLAAQLHIDLGKKLVISTNDVHGTLVEELCRVKGIFATGSEEMDGFVLIAPINFLRKVFDLPPDSATQFGFVLKDADDLSTMQKRISNLLIHSPHHVLRRWSEIIPGLYAYIRMDRITNHTFQAIIIFLILFTILNTILMSVLERKREFAVLLAIGTTPWMLKQQVFVESIFIGLIGVGIGASLGTSLCLFFHWHGIDIGSLYGDGLNISGLAVSTVLRPRVTLTIVSYLSAVVFFSTILVGLLPIRRINGIEIAQTIR